MKKRTMREKIQYNEELFDRELVPFRISYDLLENSKDGLLSSEEIAAVACALIIQTSSSDDQIIEARNWIINSRIEGLSRCE